MALGHDPLSTRPLSDVEATPLAQGGDPAPLPHLGLLLGSGGGTAFDLTPTAAVALSGALSTTGAIGYGIDLEAPLNLDVAGALSVSGALGLGIGVAQTAGPAMAGSLSLAGTFEFAGPFSLAPTGAVALAGAMSVAGDVQSSILFELTPSAALALSGSLTPAGAFGSDIGVGGAVSLAGSLSLAGDTAYTIAFETGGGVALGGALSVAGDLEILANQFTLTATAAVALAGSLSVTGDVAASDAPTNPHGFEIGGPVRRRNLITIIKDEPRPTITKREIDKRRFEKARDEAREIIEKAAASHAATQHTKAERFAQVRTAIKPLAQALGDWNWISVYQRMYQDALNEQIRRELELEDAIAAAKIEEEEAQIMKLFLEWM